jgi:hypothetical protein
MLLHAKDVRIRRHPMRAFACGVALALVSAFPAMSAPPATEDSDVSNVDLCNGQSNILPEKQIEGCTALLDSADNQQVLAIIYNNRGNGYV